MPKTRLPPPPGCQADGLAPVDSQADGLAPENGLAPVPENGFLPENGLAPGMAGIGREDEDGPEKAMDPMQ
eukprot:7113524-Lingulodinium_polyedra.AAC.1